MRVSLVLGVIGNLLRLFSIAFLAPIFMAMIDGEYQVAGYFAISLVAAAAIGSVMARGFQKTDFLHRGEAMAVVSGTWLVVAAFAGVPYLFHGMPPVNAFFEAMSGLTTTGATVLDFSSPNYNRAFFLWRAMTQWFGGIGVIALFVVVLPRLGIAGRQLFFAEASTATSEGISPQVRSAATRLWLLYIGLTAILTGCLLWAGFDWYDAAVHALTTLSAGGFSPNGESIMGYANPTAEWIFVVFMVISGTSYPLQWRAVSGKPGSLLRDGEFLAYFFMCLIATLAVAMLISGGDFGMGAIRDAAFQVTSLASSTGYASVDYVRSPQWGDGARMLLVVAMLLGGCAGSACGGPKMIRYLLLFKFIRREATQVLHPRAVIPIRYKTSPIKSGVLRAVITLVVLYLLAYLVLGTIVVASGEADMVTGMSASLACLGNIGPGFGPVGPMDSFDGFSDGIKLLLAIGMWFGRLEIMAILALFHPDVWRHTRWGARTAKS